MQIYKIKKESATSDITILNSVETSRTKKSQYRVNHFLIFVYILKLKKQLNKNNLIKTLFSKNKKRTTVLSYLLSAALTLAALPVRFLT